MLYLKNGREGAQIIYKDIIKKLTNREDMTEEAILQFGTTDINEIIKALCKTKVSKLLVDAREPSNASETGRKVDSEIFNKIKNLSTKKVILAGGINEENICNILKQTEAKYIDIMTGVEITAGVKDVGKIDSVMRTVRNY